MGYTPLFDTLTKGTLCGRWPDIGLWPVVLSLADRHGTVDCTPAYIAGVTGLALDDVVACMKRFCQPDPYSRTQDHDGARLELLDAHRDWGWRVVNHSKYREKARKAAYDSDRVSSGRDADRKRDERQASRDVPTRPAMSRTVPLSDSDSDSDSDRDIRTPNAHEVLEFIKIGYPAGTFGAQNWILAERAIGKLLDAGETSESLTAAALAYREQMDAKRSTGTQFVRSPEKFYGDGFWRGPFPLPTPPPNKTVSDLITWRPTE